MHIPKTGGRYIINNVINPIKQQLEENNIEVINVEHFYHSNWYSKIDDETYIISVLREPSSQVISLYTHKITTSNKGDLITHKNFKLSKDKFYQTIKQTPNYKDFQSKSFMINEKGGFILNTNDIDIDEGLLEKRINRVNLLLNHNNIAENVEKIQQKIFLDLGINGATRTVKDNGIYYNPHSRHFYNTFSDAEKESIRVYNSIDSQLYKNANYYKI